MRIKIEQERAGESCSIASKEEHTLRFIATMMNQSVVKNIIDQLIHNYSFIEAAIVGIKKLHPPMPGEIGHSFVQLTYTSSK